MEEDGVLGDGLKSSDEVDGVLWRSLRVVPGDRQRCPSHLVKSKRGGFGELLLLCNAAISPGVCELIEWRSAFIVCFNPFNKDLELESGKRP